MLTCTVSMVESAIAIIIACLPALRSMFIGGSTRGDPSSYGRHYELSSAGRKITGARGSISGMGSSATASRAGAGRRRDPNGSEDSLVTDEISLESGRPGASSSNKSHGIQVQTEIKTTFESGDEHSKAESSKSPV